MRNFPILFLALIGFQSNAQLVFATGDFGGFVKFPDEAGFEPTTILKDKSIARGTAQFKLIFKEVETEELLSGVKLEWSYKNTNGSKECDGSQQVLVLDRRRITFQVHLDGYDNLTYVIKPKNQHYYEYIVYLQPLTGNGDASGDQ